jgi:hypothetical protein
MKLFTKFGVTSTGAPMQRQSLDTINPIAFKALQPQKVEQHKQPQTLDAKSLQHVGGGRGFPNKTW